MNWVKNLVDKVKASEETSAFSSSRVGTRQALQVRQLLVEFLQTSEKEARELKLRELVPQFLDVFGESTPEEIADRFNEVYTFTYHVARHLVMEVRRRGNHESPQVASQCILDYFAEPFVCDGIFQMLHIVAKGQENFAAEMARASLPSTLCKCIYTFINLPVVDDAEEKAREVEVRTRVQAQVVTLLARLGQRAKAVEEMVKTGDFRYLFRAITTPSDPINYAWRLGSMDTLRGVFLPKPMAAVIVEVHEKQYVQRTINTLRKMQPQIAPTEMTDALSCILAVVSGSVRITPSLQKDFEECQGPQIIVQWIIDLCPDSTEPAESTREDVQRLLNDVMECCYSGPIDIRPDITPSPYQGPGFKVPTETAAGRGVRNPQAFSMLQSLFSVATNTWLKSAVLDGIMQVLTADVVNYYVLHKYHGLSACIDMIDQLEPPLQQRVIKILEFVVCSLNFVPMTELTSLQRLLTDGRESSFLLAVHSANKFMNLDSKYQDIFREIGMLDILLDTMQFVRNTLYDRQHEELRAKLDNTQTYLAPAVIAGLFETLEMMLGNKQNLSMFRNGPYLSTITDLIAHDTTQKGAMKVAEVLLRGGWGLQTPSSGMYQAMGALLDLLSRSDSKPISFVCRAAILDSICKCMAGNTAVRAVFREVGGFGRCMALLAGMASDFAPPLLVNASDTSGDQTRPGRLSTFHQLLHCMSCAMAGDRASTAFFETEIGCETLAKCIKETGILESDDALSLFVQLLDFACESYNTRLSASKDQLPEDGVPPVITNPNTVVVALQLAPNAKKDVQEYLFSRLLRLATLDHNRQIMSEHKVLEALVDTFQEAYQEEGDWRQDYVYGLFEALGQQRLSPEVLKAYLRLLQRVAVDKKQTLFTRGLETLVRISNHCPVPVPDYIEVDMSKQGCACLYMPGRGDRPWPPQNGYSFAAWIYIDQWGDDFHPVRLFSLLDPTGVQAAAYINPMDGQLVFQMGGVGVQFSEFEFQPNTWYHVALVHVRHRMRPSAVTLYVNGVGIQALKLSYFGNPGVTTNADIVCVIGTSSGERGVCRLKWRLGPAYLFDEGVSRLAVIIMYFVGTRYHGNFQGTLKHFQTYEVISHSMLSRLGQNELAIFNLSNATSLLPPEERIIYSIHCCNELHRQAQVGNIFGLYEGSHKLAAKILGEKAITDESLVFFRNGTDSTVGDDVIIPLSVMGDARFVRPLGIAESVRSLGGVPVILFLIQDAQTPAALLALVRLMVAAIKYNSHNTIQMESIQGYPMLSITFKRKAKLLTTDLVDALFDLVGKPLGAPHLATISNVSAFKSILLDFEIWKNADIEVQRHLLHCIYDICHKAEHRHFNIRRLRKLQMIQKLLFILRDESLSEAIVQDMVQLLSVVFEVDLVDDDWERLARFMVTTVHPDPSVGDSEIRTRSSSRKDLLKERDAVFTITARKIFIRNNILEALLGILDRRDRRIMDCFQRILGAQWLMLFITAKMNHKTVVLALRMLAVLLVFYRSNPTVANTFKGSLQGIARLRYALEAHAGAQQTYFILLSIFIGKPADIPFGVTLSLSTLHTIFPISSREGLSPYLPEVNIVVMRMLKVLHEHWLRIKNGTKLTEFRKITSRENLSTGSAPILEVPEPAAGDGPSPMTSPRMQEGFGDGADPLGREWGIFDIDMNNAGQIEEACLAVLKYLIYLYKKAPSHGDLFLKAEYVEHLVAIIFPLYYDPSVLYGAAPDLQLNDVIPQLAEAAGQGLKQGVKQGLATVGNLTIGTGKRLASMLIGYEQGTGKAADPGSVTDLSSQSTDTDTGTKWKSRRSSGVFSDDFELVDSPVQATDTAEYRHVFDSSTLFGGAVAEEILGFLRALVLEAFTLDSKSSFLEAVLEAAPSTLPELEYHYQTEVLHRLMSYVQDLDTVTFLASMVDDTKTMSNLCRLATVAVDRLSQGQFTMPRGPDVVFDFLLCVLTRITDNQLDNHQKRVDVRPQLMEQLYRAINRVVLHQLSQPDNTAGIAETLNKMINAQKIIFAKDNVDFNFLTGVCHYLLQLVLINQPSVRVAAMTLCKLLILQKEEEMKVLLGRTKPTDSYCLYDDIHEMLLQMNIEAFAKWLTDPTPVKGASKSVKEVLDEHISEVYHAYEASDMRMQMDLAHQRSQLRLARLQRKYRRERNEMEHVRSTHTLDIRAIKRVQVYEDSRYNWYRQQFMESQSHVAMRANRLVRELTRERAMFGVDAEQGVMWMLDSIEGPYRIRKRMCRNTLFAQHYPRGPDGTNPLVELPSIQQAVPEAEQDDLFTKEMQELQSLKAEGGGGPIFDMNGSLASGLASSASTGAEAEKEDDEKKNTDRAPSPAPSDSGVSDTSSQAKIQDGGDGKSENATGEEEGEGDSLLGGEEEEEDSWSIKRLLEPGDDIEAVFNCARIHGLDVIYGIILICQRNVYIIDGYCVAPDPRTGRADIFEIQQAIYNGTFVPSVPAIADNLGGDSGPIARPKKTHTSVDEDSRIRCAFEDILEVHKRKYLLRDVAIEIFSGDGRETLLAFNKSERDVVYSKLMQNTATDKRVLEAGSALGLSGSTEEAAGFFSRLLGEKSPTTRWVNGEMSNFQYLMWVNTVAGRSFNDLTQYPVFPWILSNYDSVDLDLTDERNFRDLSKPMGDQDPKRAQSFLQRYENWEDPSGETPPFHYGTHYSSAMIVASYLVRLEPFTQMFLALQGGHFDHPDRMFFSIKDAWLSASQQNTADVKELIPEFFYLPEFLQNTNHFKLGVKQTGERVDDVVLPAWAKGDVHEFIRVHREALESDYVSLRLHEWIDLIFGCKQQGEAAKEALNVFHHLSYEGAVDIDLIEDMVQRQATIGIINNFGQTPSQVFKKPHPQRRVFGSSLNLHTLYRYPDRLVPGPAIKDVRVPVNDIVLHDKQTIVAKAKQVLMPPNFNKYVTWEYADNTIRVMAPDSQKALLIHENMHLGPITAACFADTRTLVTAGQDAVVCVWRLSSSSRAEFKLAQELHGHRGPVTCLAASRAYSIILSGSLDSTCILWDLNQLAYVKQLTGHVRPISAVHINDQSGMVLTCAGSMLHVWTINGELIIKKDTSHGSLATITCCTSSEGPEWDRHGVLLTGHQDGYIKVWRMMFERTDEDAMHSSDSETEEFDLLAELGTRQQPQQGGGSRATWQRVVKMVGELGPAAANARESRAAAPITTMHIARNQKRLVVGDERGKVTSWVLPDIMGDPADYVPREVDPNKCTQCASKFSTARRRHHCRNCGDAFCSQCSAHRSIVPKYRIFKPVRVCDSCYQHLTGGWQMVDAP